MSQSALAESITSEHRQQKAIVGPMRDCLHCPTHLGCQRWLCMSAGRAEVQCMVQPLALPGLHITDVVIVNIFFPCLGL